MTLQRRGLLLAAPALPLLAITRPAEAETTDLILNCDTALRSPLARAAELFRKTQGIRVNLFPTPPGLILPQIARHIQNDMVMTGSGAVADAIAAGTISADAPRAGQWLNRLVLAARPDAGPSALRGRIAVSDATPGSDMDGPSIIGRMKLDPRAVLGVIDTDTVVFLLLRGEADAGLVHVTDVEAHPGLAVLAPVPDAVSAPILYSIAVTKLSRRPHPEAFIAFLVSADGAALLRGAGLEVVA